MLSRVFGMVEGTCGMYVCCVEVNLIYNVGVESVGDFGLFWWGGDKG